MTRSEKDKLFNEVLSPQYLEATRGDWDQAEVNRTVRLIMELDSSPTDDE